MHEFGVTENIVTIALDKAREARASKIGKINLVVGELSGFVPECIKFYFDFLSKDSITEGASLNFEVAPAKFRCRDCSAVFNPQSAPWVCPQCQSQSVEITGGRELYVKSMEVE